MKITTFDELSDWVKIFADETRGHVIHTMIIVGSGGLTKSTTVRNAIGDKCTWLTSSLSAFQLYCESYIHRDRLTVIDDIDDLFRDKAGVRILKSLCQTEKEKHIGWHTATSKLDNQGIPRSFITKSRVCIIANEWETINKNVSALEDRGVMLDFQPDAYEVHRIAKCPDKEVYDYIGNHLDLIRNPSLRPYKIATDLKARKGRWKEWLQSKWVVPPELELFVKLLKTETDKADVENKWCEKMKVSRPTFYRYLNALPPGLQDKYKTKENGARGRTQQKTKCA